MMNKKISFLVPVHNEEKNIHILHDEIKEACGALNGWEFSILFVDDGSTDQTVSVIKSLMEQGESVGYLILSKNFGHQAAIEAGISVIEGDAVIMMDADLQHPPSYIPSMIRVFEEGADVVQMVRNKRSFFLKGIFSSFFYWFFSLLSNTKVVRNGPNFRLISNRVIQVLRQIPEKKILLRALLPTLGFKHVVLPYDESERFAGEASYTLRKSFRFAIDTFFDFSTAPLQLVFWLGLFMALVSFIAGIGHVIVKLHLGDQIVPGFTDIITAIFFLSGCILGAIGIIGKYLMLILDQLRGRPTFVVLDKKIPSISAKES